MIQELDQMPTAGHPQRSIREYVYKFMATQGKLIDAARRSQTQINDMNLRRRYAKYARLPALRERQQDSLEETHEITERTPLAHITAEASTPRQPISSAQRWIVNPDNTTEYIKAAQLDTRTLIDSVEEIDLNPYVHTTYQTGDYVLRRYPATKIGGSTSTAPGGVARTLSPQ
jgi:hypothetical protein